MPKPAEIVAALGDVSAIESYATLRAEMVDLFTSLADWMKDRNDERQAQIFRKMAATVEMIPYDMLAEFGHNYNPVLISAVLIVQVFHADAPDYAMLTIWYSPCWMSCGASTSIILIRKRLSRSLKSSLNPWDGRTRTLRPIGKTRAAPLFMPRRRRGARRWRWECCACQRSCGATGRDARRPSP